jgi:UDPglucose 6-dehydrogenase
MNIAVIGLGHMGLPLAALLADAGRRLHGVDSDSAHLERLRSGLVGWREPGLQELWASLKGVTLTTDAAEAARCCDISIVAVPTPTGPGGGHDPRHVRVAVGAIGDGLRDHDRPHVVVVLSTVMPGTCGDDLAPWLSQRSGRALGRGLGLCHMPAFGALGALLRDYSEPDFLLIGESDPASGDIVERAIRPVLRNDAPILRRSLLDAEIAKVALNNYIIAKISFANMIGELCQNIPGSDASQVLSVLGADRRIGSRFLKAAMPYGGPCFGRDTRALEALASRFGVSAPLATAAEAINVAHAGAIVARIREATPPGGVIAVLGLAFRHDSEVTQASPIVPMVARLAEMGFRVRVWDPLAKAPAFEGVTATESLETCVEGADTVVISNDDPRCASLPPSRRPDGGAVVVFDYWRRLSPGTAGFDVRVFGRM